MGLSRNHQSAIPPRHQSWFKTSSSHSTHSHVSRDEKWDGQNSPSCPAFRQPEFHLPIPKRLHPSLQLNNRYVQITTFPIAVSQGAHQNHSNFLCALLPIYTSQACEADEKGAPWEPLVIWLGGWRFGLFMVKKNWACCLLPAGGVI